MGGTGGEQVWFNDIYCFDTGTFFILRPLDVLIPVLKRVLNDLNINQVLLFATLLYG